MTSGNRTYNENRYEPKGESGHEIIRILGVDIGGSHISVCQVDIDTAAALDNTHVRRKVNPEGPADEIIGAWADAILSCANQPGTNLHNHTGLRIGIAMPGPLDYDKGISYITGLHKFEALFGLNLKQLLADRLRIPIDHIRMVNDASAFLLGEVKGGAGKGYSKSVGITLGTGVGSASFSDNTVHDGDLWSSPFKGSRAEDYLCSRWFIQQYIAGHAANMPPPGPQAMPAASFMPAASSDAYQQAKSVTGVKELALLYDSDPAVRGLFETFGRHLAEALLMKYPPAIQDIIVIGGNITGAWDLFIPSTLDWCRRAGIQMNIRPALLGEMAAITGAAFLWK